MGWIIALAVLILLAVLPLGVRLRYDAGGPGIWVLLGPVAVPVFPVKRKEKKEKPKKEAKKEESKKSTPAKQTQGQASTPAPAKKENPLAGGSVKDFLPLVSAVLEFLGDFRRKLRVPVLELKVILGGGDPCDLAMNYGKAWAAVGNLWPRLEEFLVIRKRDVEIECDFTAGETLITARLDLTVTLGRLLAVSGKLAFRAVRELIKIMNKRKGGAAT